ncbi:hypothetical protein IFM89_011270 [Coptis chinensis]|uniref:Uncharacterized protein n=1 Tax=Coptis chinensis TaxID=261450 RepID=A0A835LR28_9MAGN|nr:hypothetical protein IFM89_011270 [Coptis chinensis]
MAKHHPDLIMCRKQPGIAIGRLCEKDDGKCVICDSYVRPCTLVRICDECNYGSFQGRCVICGGVGISDAYYCKECTQQEKDRDGCPKIVNLGSAKTDLFYERKNTKSSRVLKFGRGGSVWHGRDIGIGMIGEGMMNIMRRSGGLYNEAGRDELKYYEAEYEASLKNVGQLRQMNSNGVHFDLENEGAEFDDEYDDGIDSPDARSFWKVMILSPTMKVDPVAHFNSINGRSTKTPSLGKKSNGKGRPRRDKYSGKSLSSLWD